MTGEEWLTCCEPKALLEVLLDHLDHVSDRKMRLFACELARGCPDILADEQRKRGVELADRFADDLVTDDEREAGRMDLQLRMEEEILQQDFEKARMTCDAKRCLDLNQREFFWLNYHHHPWVPSHVGLIRDIFGNPFRPVVVDPSWRTSTVMQLVRGIYDDRAFDRMPILADALQDAGCDDPDILRHCRSDGPHVHGCWVVDLVLGKS